MPFKETDDLIVTEEDNDTDRKRVSFALGQENDGGKYD